MSLIISVLALLVAVLAYLRARRDELYHKVELEKAKSALQHSEKLLQLRANLANEVAHEIKNPVSAILSSVETMDLLLGNKLPEDHRVSLRYIKEYSKHLLTLVSDFLDLSMSEGGILKARPEVVNVHDSVCSILGLVKSLAQQNNLTVKLLCNDKSISTKMDAKHFKQIIFNLVHNAIRYTSKGGEIQVSIESDFPKPNLLVSVKDNGCGISKEALPYIFDIYARYNTPVNHTAKGLGLGLALCKNLVELAGGELSVASEENIGSTFQVKLPLYEVSNNKDPVDSNLLTVH